MRATAIVRGKVVQFRLSPGLAKAQQRNRGKQMTAEQAVAFVEAKRRRRVLREAQPYLEADS
jgi:hypothetical protein